MKRVSLFLIALFLFAGIGLKAQAPQGTAILNYSGLEKKLKNSDEDILNVKKNTKAKTWTGRAQVLLDIYNVHNDILSKGMAQPQAKLFMKDPKEVQTTIEGSDKIEVWVYERVNLTFKNGTLDSWTETQKIHPDPLPEAQKALEKAVELNTDGKASSDIKDVANNLKRAYQNEAVKAYEKQNYDGAHDNFVKELALNKLPQLENRVDTIIIYYAGRSAFENKDYTEANRLFEEVAADKFEEPLFYILRKQSYFASGDTAKGLDVIKQGFMRYSNDQGIMIELINYYVQKNQPNEALELINKAKEQDPKNISFVFTEGTLYDKLGRYDDAEKAYKHCLEMNPEYFNANYNLGVLYYNKAVKLYEEASKATDNNVYTAKQAEADEQLKLVVPYMEKSSQLDPKEKSTLDTLKTIYYRLKMDDKYKEVVEKLKNF
jgi:tetratricopeptide (TPR) repeat protein